jgi:hypothetical protein
MAEASPFCLALQARSHPAGTFNYIITRRDIPTWAEASLETFPTLEDAAKAGRAALERIVAQHAHKLTVAEHTRARIAQWEAAKDISAKTAERYGEL